MTNSYDVDHGLSQCPPGPLEPVEIAPQPGAAPATGNTARDQEMYAAGIAVGEENAKHNAAIRAGVLDGWKLVEALRESLLWTASSLAAVGKEQDLITLEGRKRTIGEILDEANAALDAPSLDCAAPGVSMVEDKPAWPSGLLDRVKGAEKRIRDGHGLMRVPADPTDPDLVLAEIAALIEGRKPPFWLRPAPAAGDALDAARYRWLREKAHQTAGRAPAAVLCDESDMFQRGEAGSESGFIHGKDLDDAIDAAIAAQRKGAA